MGQRYNTHLREHLASLCPVESVGRTCKIASSAHFRPRLGDKVKRGVSSIVATTCPTNDHQKNKQKIISIDGSVSGDGTYGTGGANRRSPTGGLAKGMPRNTHVPLRRNPFTEPLYVCTTSVTGASPGWACRGADVTAAAEAPLTTAQANQTSGATAIRTCRSIGFRHSLIGTLPTRGNETCCTAHKHHHESPRARRALATSASERSSVCDGRRGEEMNLSPQTVGLRV